MQDDSRLTVADDRDVDHDLYIERLETLYEKQLGDLRAFSTRESRSFDEVRRYIAHWHYKALLGVPGPVTAQAEQGVKQTISATMRAISDALESLNVIAGLQSFYLIVEPNDPTDEGFLGGTVQGREFWRGHRGCGAAGAQAFKLFCKKSIPHAEQRSQTSSLTGHCQQDTAIKTDHSSKRGTASALKSDVYASVRNAVRVASGLRNAEMKWTNHEKLNAYGIRLDGWPADVPIQNPSHLSTTQNKAILEALQSGSMKFVQIAIQDPTSANAIDTGRKTLTAESAAKSEADIFKDTVDFSAYPEGNDAPRGQFLTLDFIAGASSSSGARHTGISTERSPQAGSGINAVMAAESDNIRSNNSDHEEHISASELRSFQEASHDIDNSTSARKRRRMAGANGEPDAAEVPL